MRTVLWVFAWIGVAVWTIFSLVGFGVLGLVGDAARDISGHVPGFPDEFFSAPWLASLMQSIGNFALFIVWVVGTGMILAVPAVIGLFLPRRELTRAYVPEPRPMRAPAAVRLSPPASRFPLAEASRDNPRRAPH